jgi:hypothetical protein
MNRQLQKSMGIFFMFIFTFFAFKSNAQVSVTATAATMGPTSYTTLSAAFAAINAGTHQGVITITITNNTTEPAFLAANQLLASGVGSSSYQSIRIVPQGNVTVNSPATLTTGRGMLEFIGADSITIDGDDPLTAGTRNLTFQLATSTLAHVSVLRFSSSAATANTGCRNVTIKNCVIIGSRLNETNTTINYGITASGGTTAAISAITNQAADNDNMVIENNEFRRSYYGFHAYGHATNVMDSLVIRNNRFGSDVSANNIGLFPIYLGYTALTPSTGSAIVEGNEIQAGDYGLTGYSANIAGININIGNAGVTIRNNNIRDISQPTVNGWGAFGIFISSPTSNANISIFNNFISGVRTYTYQTSTTSTFQPVGILVNSAVTGLRINHNTIVMPNQLFASSTFSSHGILLTGTASLAEFNNNIIVNRYNSSAGYAVTFNGVANYSLAAMDRNNYFVAGPNLGFVNAAARTDLAAWRLSSTKDSNSFVSDPPFVSATNLRLQTGAKSPIESNGRITTILTDIDGNVRPGPIGSVNGGALAPDIGAHEADLQLDNRSVDSITVTQTPGFIAIGATNAQIMRVRFHVSGSIGNVGVTQLHFRTTGTTSATDITNAKVFFTGSNATFSTAQQFGTTFSAPNGVFTITDTSWNLMPGINHFWLTYDISPSATAMNLVDAIFDSATVNSTTLLPINGNPTGAYTLANPMPYVSSTLSQPNVLKVGQGSTNQMIARLAVVMGTGAPTTITSIEVSTNGTTSLTDITNLKIFASDTSTIFSTAHQFGSTVATPVATNIVIGLRTLLSGTNYFWITYDISASAVINNFIDAEVLTITVSGNPQVPTITAPAGSRQIRANYCNPVYTTGKTDGDLISRVRIIGTTLDNNSGTAPVNPAYTYFTGAPNFTAQLVQGNTYTMEATIGSFGSQGVAAWIDYNDDGIFQTTERIGFTPTTIPNGFGSESFPITLSCASTPGTFRMRVRCVYFQNGNTIDPCASYTWGEAEDYDVTILLNPLAYQFSTAVQQTGAVALGSVNNPVLRIPIRASGCDTGVVENLNFRTVGTTNLSDISNARLYKTGNSPVFNTSTLVATIPVPTTNLNFVVNDSLVANDTTNYWLTYDILPTATISNVVDAVLDSMFVLGNWEFPTTTNPAGNREIQPPLLYTSSTVTQNNTTIVRRGQTNREVVGLRVIMSPTGVPIRMDSLVVGTSTTLLSNISNLRVWFTGSSSQFATTNQYGTTIATPTTTQTIAGTTLLNADTNYFWVTYDIAPTALLGDSIDAEITQLYIAGLQTPIITSPSGSRLIEVDYCIASHFDPCPAFGTTITNVTFGSINNNTTCANTNGNSWTEFNITPTTTTNVLRGTVVNLSVTVDNLGAAISGVWIDLNRNGIFETTEFQLISANQAAGSTVTIPISIPCNAVLGSTMMRIRTTASWSTLTSANSCSFLNQGETEDYNITIIDNPVAYSSSLAIQQIGTVAPGANDQALLRLPIRANGCGIAELTDLFFTYTGTNVGNITAAKIYRTTGAVFNTTNLIATILSPSATMNFTLLDTLMNNDTTNYWLAIDVSASATLTNTIDVSFDSLIVLSVMRYPVVSNPTGNLIINAPMTYVSSTVTQAITSAVEQGSNNNQILGLTIVTSATGSPIQLTSLDIATTGTTSLLDISNLRVWYTGANNTFATTTQFGGTVATPTLTNSVSGAQNLVNGTNYFWITYDIPVTATLNNVVDAEVTSIIVASNFETPTISAPVGNRSIRAPYCVPAISFGCGIDYISQVTTIGAITNVNNLTTCNGNINSFIFNNNLTVTANAGQIFTINLMAGGDIEGLGVWIDFNNDGIYSANEFVFSAPPSINVLQTGTITVPLNATLGITRMRVRAMYNQTPLATDACTAVAYGETEDYNFNILPAPPVTAYVWNQTIPSAYTTAANWTPTRTFINLNDRLVFNSGISVTVNSVPTQTINSMVISNGTSVVLTAPDVATLTIRDTLRLANNSLINMSTAGNNVRMRLGRGVDSLTQVGVIDTTSGGGRIQGRFGRFISTAGPASYYYPLAAGTNMRAITLNYTTAPTTGGVLSGEFFAGAPGTAGLPLSDPPLSIANVATAGIWQATNEGIVGGTFDLSALAQNVTGVNNVFGTSLIFRTDVLANWGTAGTYAPSTGTTTALVLNRTGIPTTSGQIGIGGDASNPLPVTLLSFEGRSLGNDVVLNWITTSEFNNSGFVVERSIDGRNFERVTFVNGQINSRVRTAYQTIDEMAFRTAASNVLYYRLRQVDVDGSYTYSNVVRVSFNERNGTEINVQPNPFTGNTNVVIASTDANSYTIRITDIQGKFIAQRLIAVEKGMNVVSLTELDNVVPGVYFVQVQGADSKLIKVVKSGN